MGVSTNKFLLQHGALLIVNSTIAIRYLSFYVNVNFKFKRKHHIQSLGNDANE